MALAQGRAVTIHAHSRSPAAQGQSVYHRRNGIASYDREYSA